MLTGFYTNMGMGSNNLAAIHPPSIVSDDIATFLCFDRILVDGRSFDWMFSEGTGPEKWFFSRLIERKRYSRPTSTTAQACFA